MSSHGVTPRGHAPGYSSRLVTGRGIGPVSQHMQFPVTTTPVDIQVSGCPDWPLTSTGALIMGNLG